jgi:hypothetical protein
MGTTAIADLEHSVRDFFLRLYDPDGTRLAQLGFENVGVSVEDSQFRVPADGPFNREKAIQETSTLVDHCLLIAAGTAERTMLSVTALQEFVLSAAAPAATPPDRVAIFERMKAEAARNYDTCTRPSTETGIDFAAVDATPDHWFDPAAPIWTAYSFTAEDRVDAPQQPPRPPRWTWGVLQGDVAPVLKQPPAVANKMLLMMMATPVAAPPPPPAPPPQEPGATMVSAAQKLAAARMVGGAFTREAPHTLGKRRLFGKVRLTPEVADATAGPLRGGLGGRFRGPLDKKRLASELVLGSGVVAGDAAATPEPIKANRVTLSFKYALVNIDRPWWVGNVLQLSDWYVPGLPANYFSDGKDEENQGKAPVLPVAFIAVRELAITGSWSDSDQAVMDRSLRLGPFSLAGRTIERSSTSVSLTVPGIQIVAWLGQTLPPCPPLGDPQG